MSKQLVKRIRQAMEDILDGHIPEDIVDILGNAANTIDSLEDNKYPEETQN